MKKIPTAIVFDCSRGWRWEATSERVLKDYSDLYLFAAAAVRYRTLSAYVFPSKAAAVATFAKLFNAASHDLSSHWLFKGFVDLHFFSCALFSCRVMSYDEFSRILVESLNYKL